MRAATWALLASLAFAFACGPSVAPGAKKGQPAPQKTTKEEQAKKLPGEYTCSFEISEEAAGDATCAIDRAGENFELEASGGEQTLTGTLTPTDYGFKFEGQYTCTTGDDCSEDVRTDFFEKEDGVYSGVIELLDSAKLLTVTMTRR